MKTIFKYSLMLIASVTVLVACKDSDDLSSGGWDAAPDYADIFFPKTSQSFELEPTDPTTVQIEVIRRNTNGPLTVGFEVLQNDSNIFVVDSAAFADGDSLAVINVNFPDAEIGTPYKLTLTTTDHNLVSSYSDQVLYSMSVTRIKWNDLGLATFIEGFWYESTDQCHIYQRDDKPTQFRLEDPFKWARDNNYTDGNESPYITMTIYTKSEVDAKAGTDDELMLFDEKIADHIGDDDLVYFEPLNTGFMHPSYNAEVRMYHPAHFASLSDWTYNHVVTYQKEPVEVNGVKRILPGKINLAPYYYMIGIGGWNNTDNEGIVQIFFPGYVDPHVADIGSSDFTWAEVFTGSFSSEKFGASEAKLYVGTCVNTEDGCDTVFANTYGTAYKIAEPYAVGYDLYFTVDKNGKIITPDGYRLQPIGLDDNMGHDIYAKIDQTASSFSETEIVLSINFVDEEEELDYGTCEEVIANIKWNTIGTADYTYAVMVDEGPETDEGLPLFQRDDKPYIYKMTEWFMGEEFMFSWNKETNQVVVPMQYTGLSYTGYGDVYVCDIAQFTGNDAYYSEYPCEYDPETDIFSVNLIYFIYQAPNDYQWMKGNPETFKLHLTSEEVKAGHITMDFSTFNPGNARKLFKQKNAWQGKQKNKKNISASHKTVRDLIILN